MKIIFYLILNLIEIPNFADKIESEEFYAELQSPLNTQLVTLSSEIDQYLQGANSSSNTSGKLSPKPQSSSAASPTNNSDALSAKFLYINDCNLRHNGTLSGKSGALSRDLINILMDLYEETDERNISEETIVKTMNDYWIFRKKCNSRMFFVLINKYATLLEISGEERRESNDNVMVLIMCPFQISLPKYLDKR